MPVAASFAANVRRLRFTLRVALHASFRRPKWLAIPFLTFLGVATLLSVRVQSDLSMENWDPNLSAAIELDLAKNSFDLDPSVLMIVRRPDGALDRNDLCAIQSWIASDLATLPGLRSANTIFDLRTAVYDSGRLNYVRSVPDPCAGDRDWDAKRIAENLRGRPLVRTLFDSDFRDFAILLHLDELNSDRQANIFRELANRAASRLKSYEIVYTGEVALVAHLRDAFSAMGLLNLAIVFLILLFSRVMGGTWRLGFVLISTIALTTLAVRGGMALMGHRIDTVTVGLFPLLAIAAIEDLYFLAHLSRETIGTGRSWRSAFRRLLLASFLTSATTAIGFGSLLISSSPSVRVLGGWAACGAILEWGICFLLLPALFEIFPAIRLRSVESFQKRERFAIGWLRETIDQLSLPPRLSARVAIGCLIGGVAFAITFQEFKISNSFADILPRDHSFQAALRYLKETRGWEASADLLVKRSLDESARRRIVDFVSSQPSVKDVDDIESIVDDIGAGVPASHRALVESELRFALPAFHSYGDFEKATVYLRSSDISTVEFLRRDVASMCSDGSCMLVGSLVAFAEDSRHLIATLFESIWLSVLMVGILLASLAVAIGCSRREIAVILGCAFWGLAMLLGVIGVFGVKINGTTCIVACTLVGLMGDNTIVFLLTRDRSSVATSITNLASPARDCALLAALIALTMTFSPFMPMRTIGLLLAFGLASAYVSDVWFQRALLGDGAQSGLGRSRRGFD